MTHYHYTSLDALTSIVQNGQLWLTRSEFLNDPLDCKLLFKLFQDYVKEHGQQDFDKWLGKVDSKYHEELKALYKIVPPEKYLEFLLSHIPLYVLSLTGDEDAMSMWNYYGNGGVSIAVSTDDTQAETGLAQTLCGSLCTPGGAAQGRRYLVCADVLYVDEKTKAASIGLEGFNASFTFRCVAGGPGIDYQNDRLDNLFKSFFRGCLFSMQAVVVNEKMKRKETWARLNEEGTAAKSKEKKREIKDKKAALSEEKMSFDPENPNFDTSAFFQEMHKDQISKTGPKHEYIKDRLLYLLTLAALLKSKSYEYENEYRVVVFENSLDPSEALPTKYRTHELNGQKYLRPYLELDVGLDFIQGVKLSPLARNLPIDSGLYRQIVEDFLKSKLDPSVSAQWSDHRMRW